MQDNPAIVCELCGQPLSEGMQRLAAAAPHLGHRYHASCLTDEDTLNRVFPHRELNNMRRQALAATGARYVVNRGYQIL